MLNTNADGNGLSLNVAAEDRKHAVRHLQELIAAIDRRVPHIERAGEMGIAQDAAALKEKALARIDELEQAE